MRSQSSALSIRRKLPVLICGLLFVVAVGGYWLSNVEVQRSARDSARDRLKVVTAQMAEILQRSTDRTRPQMYALAHNAPIVAFLDDFSAATEERAQHLIDSLATRSTLVAGLEIWGPDGAPLLASAGGLGGTNPEAAQQLVSRVTDSDTAIVGPLRTYVDSLRQEQVVYPLIAPVRTSTGLAGYFVLQRRQNTSPQEMQQIRDLIGTDVGVFLGSPETGVWTDLSTTSAAPPVPVLGRDSLLEYRREDRGWQLAAAAPVEGTPFLALVEFPRPQVLQGTIRVASRFAMMSLVLLLIGWLGAWIISRDITRPIANLAAGADAIAAGDYTRRVQTTGRKDELGALAHAFNTMAANVGESVEQLATDLRERKRAEAALREADEMIRSMVQSSPLPIIAFEADGRIKLWNSAAEQTFGWTAGEVVGAITPTVNDAQRAEHNALRERAMKGEVFTGLSITRQRKDGKPVRLKLSCAATFDAAGKSTGVTAIFEDVTDSDKLEEQLRQAQKMEAVGRLAGGVAHDFNNLLTVVLGASDLLLLELPENDPHRSVIGEIREAGERAAALTTQLLAFSRKQLVEPKVFVVNELVADINKMLRRLIGEDIEVSMRLAPDLGPIEADRGQIEQVLVNLAVNARDAMPRGGALIIETANVELAEEYVRFHSGVAAGSFIMLAVSDTGTGMSEETKAHLFEPFFTTKEVGRGTGLGLATCYGIVRKAGGHIGVYSEPGVGTTMKVYLPRATQGADAAAKRAPEPAARGNETILVVEDDNAVRTITLRVLKAQGYKVLEAADGPTALAALGSYPGEVALLFTDVVLPGMGGREVAERARALRPGMKILFTSGYTDDVILQNKLLEHNVLVLQKPFTPATLATKVRQILDAETT